MLYGAAEPESLRGPQHSHGWADEIAKWPNGEDGWDNLMMGMRLGQWPRIVATTTPRPVPLLRRLVREGDVVVTRGRTAENGANLPGSFLSAMESGYQGTRLGRQELDGELIEELEGALWNRDLLERRRVRTAPAVKRMVVGVDPPASAHGDACGIVAVALCGDGRAYLVADASVSGRSPEGWARAVAEAASVHGADRVVAEANNGGAMVESVLRAADMRLPVRLVHASRGKSARAEPVGGLVWVCVGVVRWGGGRAYLGADASVSGGSPEGWARAVAEAASVHGADRVVAEANNGGAMVESVLRAADMRLPVRLVHASRGKSARAEPVAALYESGRALHCGAFPELEDEMCGLLAGGGSEGPGRSAGGGGGGGVWGGGGGW